MPKEFSSEGLRKEHKDTARELGWAKGAKENLEGLPLLNRIIAGISGRRREIESRIEQKKTTYEENLRVAHEHIDAMHEEAEGYVKTYEVYTGEQERLIQELGRQYARRVEAVPWPESPVDVSEYIDEVGELKVEDGTSLKDKARIAAAVDVFKPRMNHPGYAGQTFVIGEGYHKQEVAVHNGNRFPRWELGQNDVESASRIARQNGWDKVLKISTTVTAPQEKGSDEPPYVMAEKNVYVAVSDDTAKLLEQAGVDNLNSSSTLRMAWGREAGRHTGAMHESFSVIELEPAQREE